MQSSQGTLDFKSVDKITFVGASSNTVIDTTTGSVGIGVDVNGLPVPGTGSLTVPNGTAAQRPALAVSYTGMLRYNSTTGNMEAYTASGWGDLAPPLETAITLISPASYDDSLLATQVVTVTGVFFDSLMTLKLLGQDGTTVLDVSDYTFINHTVATFKVPNEVATLAQSPYTIRITSASGTVIDSVGTLAVNVGLYDFTSFTFTNAGVGETASGHVAVTFSGGPSPPHYNTQGTVGSNGTASSGTSATKNMGPTLTDVRNAYSAYSWTHADAVGGPFLNVTSAAQGIQEWTVPKTASYTILAMGGAGGSGNEYGSRGIEMSLTLTLTKSQVVRIIVGQQGGQNSSYGGGGGTYVFYNVTDTYPILVAGGGGANAQGGYNPNTGTYTDANIDGQAGTSGAPATDNAPIAANGAGGYARQHGGGGAGWLADGADGPNNSTGGGHAPRNSSTPAKGGNSSMNSQGGFGGGGGTHGNNGGGGGGGGYSGGTACGGGHKSGGGGSYGGTATGRYSTGHGYVHITRN